MHFLHELGEWAKRYACFMGYVFGFGLGVLDLRSEVWLWVNVKLICSGKCGHLMHSCSSNGLNT